MAQLRMCNSDLNSQLHSINLIDSPNCLCVEPETIEHFLLRCHLHNDERAKMLTNLSYLHVQRRQTQQLLHGFQFLSKMENEEAYYIVSDFVHATQRFTQQWP